MTKLDFQLQAHPVTSLRVHMLTARLRVNGSEKLTASIAREWEQIAVITKAQGRRAQCDAFEMLDSQRC